MTVVSNRKVCEHFSCEKHSSPSPSHSSTDGVMLMLMAAITVIYYLQLLTYATSRLTCSKGLLLCWRAVSVPLSPIPFSGLPAHFRSHLMLYMLVGVTESPNLLVSSQTALSLACTQ